MLALTFSRHFLYPVFARLASFLTSCLALPPAGFVTPTKITKSCFFGFQSVLWIRIPPRFSPKIPNMYQDKDLNLLSDDVRNRFSVHGNFIPNVLPALCNIDTNTRHSYRRTRNSFIYSWIRIHIEKIWIDNLFSNDGRMSIKKIL